MLVEVAKRLRPVLEKRWTHSVVEPLLAAVFVSWNRFIRWGRVAAVLVLTRKLGETIRIMGSDIVVTVLAVSGRQVRVGIEARRRRGRPGPQRCQTAVNSVTWDEAIIRLLRTM
jgi:hypothetical protein